MINKKIVLISFLVLGLFLPASAYRCNFTNYSIEEGLGQSQVHSVLQDSRGFIWCGTNGGGINRFDGRKFEHFSEKDGLSDDVVTCIIEDRQGELWIGTRGGITRYDYRKFTPYTVNKHGLNRDTYVWSILEDRSGAMWFGTDGDGVIKFDGKNFIHYRKKDGLPDDRVKSILQDREGDLWFATEAGVGKFEVESKTFRNYTEKDGLLHEYTRYIYEDLNGSLWFATKSGISKFDGKTFSHITTENGLCSNDVYFILQDTKGHYWFTTQGGVSEYDGVNFTTYTTKNGLPHNTISAMWEDREGNMWFGTDFGLSKLSGKMLTYLGTEDGLGNAHVWGFWEDKEGVLWISTEAGANKYYSGSSRLVTAEVMRDKKGAYPLFEDSKGNLWFGTMDNDLWFYAAGSIGGRSEKGLINLTLKEGLKKALILSIFEDKSGNIWLGTSEEGVRKYDGKTFKTITTKDGLLNDTVSSITQDRNGNILFGTEGGLSIYNGAVFKNIAGREGHSFREVMCVLVDRWDNIWFGTYGNGVIKYSLSVKEKGSEIDTITAKDGLNNEVILSMVFDDYGHLIIGTDKGINILDFEEYSRTGEKIIHAFGKYEGFRGIECNQNAVYKDKQGNIWFGTVKGAIRYNPKEFEANEKEPLTQVTSLKLFFKNVDFSGFTHSGFDKSGLPIDLALPYKMNHVTLEYTGISLTAPEKVRYRVKLEGFEENWTPISQTNTATYSNLSPGNYTFKVSACNNNGIWNKVPAAFSFSVIAPFWQSWWFYSLCFLCSGLVVYFVIKGRTGVLEKQRRFLEEKVKERTKEVEKEKAKVEQINLELEQRVKERTEKLVITNKQLMQAQKMEAIGRLASGVAHDLNNVLAGIVTLPEMLAQKTPKDNPLREYLLMIQRSGEKAAAIVRDLLTLARRGVAITESVNLNDIVNEYLKSPGFKKLKTDHPKVSLEVELENKLYNMQGSPIHLFKSLMNLITNAAEAMPEGGKITITTKNRYLDQPVRGYDEVAAGNFIELTVSDCGVGISSDDMEKIFEPFYTKKHMGRSGTGLGMAVVWGTVQDHHGYIEVQSAEGKGTTIIIDYPAAAPEEKKEKRQKDKKDYKSRGEAILVVDDEDDQREIASLILRELGYNVSTVSSGREAIAYLKKHPVDLVILDMIMEPGIDGCETYKRIVELVPGQKAIIVSGFSEDNRVKKAQRMGAGPFLKKPYLKDEINLAIQEELGKQRH